MKRIIRFVSLFLVGFFMLTKLVCSQTGPYLTIDPYPEKVNGETVSFLLEFNGQPGIPVSPIYHSEGFVVFRYYLNEIPYGTYSVYAKAKVGTNVSGPSNECRFTKKLPDVPGGVSISTN